MKDKDKKIEKLNSWLLEYQADIDRIVGKYRFSNHALEHEEVVSEVNLGIIKSYDKIILNKDQGMPTQSDFNKIAYSYARNYIKWTADGVSNKDKKYLEKKVDGGASGEEKNSFDIVCETLGKEDSFFAKLNDSDKFQNLLSWIFDYSHFLSPHKKNILELLLTGKTLDQIAELAGVTHQAISHLSIEMFKSIKGHVKVDLGNEDSDRSKMLKGNKAINDLFGPERKKRRMNPECLSLIKSKLFDHPNKYSLHDLEKLLGGKYSIRQICAFVNRSKYHHLLKVKKRRKTSSNCA